MDELNELSEDIGPQNKYGSDSETTHDALPSLPQKIIHGYKKRSATGKSKHEDQKTVKDLPRYKWSSDNKYKGYAVIINNENFHWSTGMNQRRGTDADGKNLQKLFSNLNFTVKIYKDISCESILKITQELASYNHTSLDCFVMAFLSHGDDGVIYGSDGTVEIKHIVDAFRGDSCPSLAGKPKIFIFQACRGGQHEIPVEPCEDRVDGTMDSTENEVVVDSAVKPTIPSGSDFLFCYSVAEGFYSHRDTLYGSWYIQALVEVFEEQLLNKGAEHAQMVDVHDLLTLVNRKVSMRSVERSRNPQSIGKKQMPCFLSMLTKKLYFV